MTSNNRNCKVCFDYVEAQTVNKNIHGMLQTFLINSDILSSENSVICTTCQEKLENCYYFKKKCMFTEGTLDPFINKNVKMNLNEIPIPISKSEDVEKDKNVCRLCLQYSDGDTILSKDEKEQFQALFPEINLNLTNYVVLCLTCYNMLQKYLLFVPLLSRSEKPLCKFTEECDPKQNYGNSLGDCQEFTSAEQVDEKKIVLLNEEVHIKSEEEGPLCSGSMDCNIEQVNGMKSEETLSTSMSANDEDDKKMMLFHEELDIKSEGDSSEKEFFYSIPGKKKSNFKIQPNKIESEKPRLSIKNLTVSEENCNSQQKNTQKYQRKARLKNRILCRHTDSSRTKKFFYSIPGKKKSNFKIQQKKIQTEKRRLSIKDLKVPEDDCNSQQKNTQKYKRKARLKNRILCQHTPCSRSKNNESDYECNLPTSLKIHTLKQSDSSKIQMYKCKKCDYKAKQKSYLKSHVLYRHTDPSESKKYKCAECDYKTKYKGDLKSHILYRHTDSPKIQMFECEECDYKAKCKGNLKKHILCRHTDSLAKHSDPSIMQMYECEKCGHRYATKYGLKRHIFLQHSELSKIQMYKCEKCDYKTKQKSSLKSHVLFRHTDSSISEKYECDKCHYKCKSFGSLKMHIRLKHSDSSKFQMYKCKECDYKAKQKAKLKTHILFRHTDPSISKKYECDKCAYKCESKWALKTHILLKHSDPSKIQMYKCKKCDYKAKQKSYLKSHVLLCHTDPSISKKYECEECDYKTKYKGDLKSHILYRHTDSPKIQMFECEECDYKAKCKGNLKKHVLCRHADSLAKHSILP